MSPTPPTHDELGELLGAYALDAVEPDERLLVEAHLATCPRCRAEVADHREVAALLAHAGQPAPEGLWDRIASSLQAPPPALELVRARPPAGAPQPPPNAARSRRWPTSARLLAAAAVVAVIALLAGQLSRLSGDLDDMEERLAAEALTDDLPDLPDGVAVAFTAADEQVRGIRALVSSGGDGYLDTGNLPALPMGRTYQLWGDTGDRVVSLKLLGRNPDPVEGFEATGRYVALAITAEDSPGAVITDQPPVASGQIPA